MIAWRSLFNCLLRAAPSRPGWKELLPRIGLVLLLVLTLFACQQPAGSQKSSLEREQLKALLKDNPRLLLEALAEEKLALYELVAAGEKIKQRQLWLRSISQGLDSPLQPRLEPNRPWHGPRQAPLVIVEYSDFLCPSCAVGARNLAQVFAKHPDKFRILVKHNPGSDLGRRLAVYFEAIGRQSPAKAWRFYQQVFARQSQVHKQKLAAVQRIVKDLGVDQARLARDLADPALAERVQQDIDEARALKLHGTPTFVVAGVPVRGPAPLSAFEDIIRLWEKRQKVPRRG